MSGPTRLTSGFDAAWGGLGWALGTQHGPIAAGHLVPDNKSHRMPALLDFLRGEFEHLVVEAQLELGPDDPPHRAAIERLPWNYKRKGNQVRTVYGVSGIAHVIAGWACRPGWLHPWLVPPRDDRPKRLRGNTLPRPGWRQWWGITVKGRAAKKRAAINLVHRLGWGHLLDQHADIDANGDGPRGDVAEGILIQVGSARHHKHAPATPVAWNPPQPSTLEPSP